LPWSVEGHVRIQVVNSHLDQKVGNNHRDLALSRSSLLADSCWQLHAFSTFVPRDISCLTAISILILIYSFERLYNGAVNDEDSWILWAGR
jgi:hypothetical protein